MAPGLKLSILVGTALTTALFHTLIPDHWLPFVLIGRARGWGVRTTALYSGFSAVLHAAVSVGLGLAALAVGLTWVELIGHSLARASAVLLVAFGVAYAAWAWHKGGHFHPGGSRLHERQAPPCEGREGERHPEHLHYHADGELIHGADRRSGLYLATIVGINPCVLILPILLSTVEEGAATMALVTGAYSATTIVLMVGLSVIGVAGTRRIPVPGIARHMEAASGLLIAVAGVVFLFLD